MISLALVFMIGLQSCAVTSRPVYDLPYAYDDRAPPLWKLGWEHGCKSGFTVYGSNFYRTLYKFTQDVDRMKDETYYKAWMDSFNYCRHYINRYLAGESFSYQGTPGVISSTGINITSGDKRDDRALTATGLFSNEKTNKGLFSSMFDVNVQSNSWGNNVEEDCDWLNRCGADKPADWHF